MSERYTLNSKYILKKNSPDSFELYDTRNSKKYGISKEFYLILSLFKYNCIEKNEVFTYFRKKNIPILEENLDIQLQKHELLDVLEKATKPHTKFIAGMEDLSKLPYFVNNTPSRVDIILTERCNIACKHCFQNSSPLIAKDFAPLEELKILFDELEELNILTVKLSGGEVMLHPDIHAIVEYLAEKKYQKTILTNALLLDDRFIQSVKNTNTCLGVSLDGATRSSHEFLRGKHTFDRTLRHLYQLTENKIPYTVTVTLHPYNYTEIEEIFDLVCNKLKAVSLNYNFLQPVGRGNNNKNLLLSKEQIKRTIEKINTLKSLHPDKKIDIMDLDMLSDHETKKEIVYCSAGTKSIAINPELGVYPCTYAFGMDQFKMGDAVKEKISDIWKNPKWNIFRGKTRLSDLPTCSKCKLNKICNNLNCRIVPITQGGDFYSPISHCARR